MNRLEVNDVTVEVYRCGQKLRHVKMAEHKLQHTNVELFPLWTLRLDQILSFNI